MLNIKETGAYITIEVKVIPGMSKNELTGEQNGALKIKINAAPEKGKANKELVDFLSSRFGIKKADIEVIKGQASRMKSIRISGINKTDFLKKMDLH
jgi:uncharacterized protein (TIGR00251 family)